MRSFLALLILPMYILAFYGKLSSRILSNSFIAITGGMCYSIYLMHVLLMSLSFRLIKHLSFRNDIVTSWVQILLVITVIVASSAVYFVLIERPCMNPRWPQDLLARLRGHHRSETATTT